MSIPAVYFKIPFHHTGNNHSWTVEIGNHAINEMFKTKIPDGYIRPIVYGDTINDCFGVVGLSKAYPNFLVVFRMPDIESKAESK